MSEDQGLGVVERLKRWWAPAPQPTPPPSLGGVGDLIRRYEEGHRQFQGAQLSRAALTEAHLKVANLSHADLSFADLTDADLKVTDLSDANLSGSTLTGANLTGANLCGTRLNGADLDRASLSRADLAGADLTGASLRLANLSFTNLAGANLQGADLSAAYLRMSTGEPGSRQNCRLDLKTFTRSEWSTNTLAQWHQAGALITDFEAFSQDIRDAVLGERIGLTLFFDTRIDWMDRFVIESVILGTLGPETDCEVVAFKQLHESARVRILAQSRVALVKVAEALLTREWEGSAQTTALTDPVALLQSARFEQGLRHVSDHLDRMELRLDGDDTPLVWDNRGIIDADQIQG